MLLTLRRAGVQEVIFPSESQALQPWLQSYQGKSALPRLTWLDYSRRSGVDATTPVLGVRGGVLFAPQLLRWFREALGNTSTGKASRTGDTLPVLLAFTLQDIGGTASEMPSFESLAARLKAPAMTMPQEMFCHTVRELAQPGRDRVLLSLVGKPTDRWHVQWVRRWTFPAIRWLASTRLTPNHITWVGFLVALTACVLIAQGRYWLGIVGALLLYASWVLDCMDGTLARLTFAESAFGQKLDTILGHLTNLCIFSALIWAVYGKEPLWQAAGMAVFILGGIAIAYRVSEKEKTYRSSSGPSPHGRLRGLLDKINHRDYAVLVFFLAVVKGFAIFLWLSLVGVQIYWLLHLWLIRQHQRARVQP
jgi:phosphatidylglycerophosphate synthase